MSFDNTDRTWAEVQRTGHLHDNIKNLNDYQRQWNINQQNVKSYLHSQKDSPYLTSDQIKEVHRLSFDGIAKYSGKFTEKQMTFGGHLGAPPGTVEKEMALLDRQMETLWSKAGSQEAQVKAVAFQHSRLLSIHGFMDGNGRTSRIASEHAINKITGGRIPTHDIDRKDYLQANTAAIERSNIGRLSNIFSQQYGLESKGQDLHIAPFKVAASQDTKQLSFKNSQILPAESINRESTKGQFLKPSDMDNLLVRTGGKKGKNFDKINDKFVADITEPKTVGETVDYIKQIKNSGAIKRPIISNFNEKGFTDFAQERFRSVFRFADPEAQKEIWDRVEKQMEGKSKGKDTDKFIQNLKTKVPAQKIERPASKETHYNHKIGAKEPGAQKTAKEEKISYKISVKFPNAEALHTDVTIGKNNQNRKTELTKAAKRFTASQASRLNIKPNDLNRTEIKVQKNSLDRNMEQQRSLNLPSKDVSR